MIPQPAAKCLNTAMQKLNTAIVTLWGYRSARLDLDKKQMKYVVSEHFPDLFTINILWLVRFVDQHFLYMSICNIKYSR